MGLKASPHDPFLLSGILDNPYSPQTISNSQSQLHVGLYVDNFVFYSSDPTQEALFQTFLQEQIRVDFMGYVDYFLGVAFTWLHNIDGKISVHLCQSEFTEFTVYGFSVQSVNKVPNMTPYRSSFPIDSIPPVDPLDPDIPCQIQVHQSIIGCINWIDTCTRPDISPVLTLIAAYSNFPHPQNYKDLVHSLKYLMSTNEYVISFHSESFSTFQGFNHFPHQHDREAHTEAIAPSP